MVNMLSWTVYVLTHVCLVVNVADSLRPVFIIPGATESRLYARVNKVSFNSSQCSTDTVPSNKWFMVYLDPDTSFNCTASLLVLTYDDKKDVHSNAPGVKISTEDVGGLESINSPTTNTSQMEYASDFLALLKSKGYTAGVNMFGLNYDWRLGVNELKSTYFKWRQLIESTYMKNNKERVVVVAHSMGGLIGTYFLRTMKPAWKAKHVHKYIPVSVNFMGSILGFSLLPGFPVPYKIGQYGHSDEISHYMNLLSQQIVALCPGYVNNLPNPLARKDRKNVVIQLPDRNLTIGNYDDIFTLLDLPNRMLKYYQKHRDNTNKNAHPGVNVTCMYSLGVPTPTRFTYRTWQDFPASPNIMRGPGDSLVEETSLAACKDWTKNKNFSFKAKILDANVADHVTTFKAPVALDTIYQLILED